MQHFSNTKLKTFIDHLTKKEFKQWGKFLVSPYCNSNKKLAELYLLLGKNYPEFNQSKLSISILSKHLYKKQGQEKQLLNLFTSAIKSLEQFLAFEAFKEDGDFQNLILLRKFRSKKQGNEAKKHRNQLAKRLISKPTLTSEDYLLF